MTVPRGQHPPLDDARLELAIEQTIKQTTLARTVEIEDRLDVVCPLEAAEIIDCSADNVRRLVRAGQLTPVIRTRAGNLFSRRAVEDLAHERRQRRAVAAQESAV